MAVRFIQNCSFIHDRRFIHDRCFIRDHRFIRYRRFMQDKNTSERPSTISQKATREPDIIFRKSARQATGDFRKLFGVITVYQNPFITCFTKLHSCMSLGTRATCLRFVLGASGDLQIYVQKHKKLRPK